MISGFIEENENVVEVSVHPTHRAFQPRCLWEYQQMCWRFQPSGFICTNTDSVVGPEPNRILVFTSCHADTSLWCICLIIPIGVTFGSAALNSTLVLLNLKGLQDLLIILDNFTWIESALGTFCKLNYVLWAAPSGSQISLYNPVKTLSSITSFIQVYHPKRHFTRLGLTIYEMCPFAGFCPPHHLEFAHANLLGIHCALNGYWSKEMH